MNKKIMKYKTIQDLCDAIQEELASGVYQAKYDDESAFEFDVWERIVSFMSEIVDDVSAFCLTSHISKRNRRSSEAWKKFCSEDLGPDVNVLGSNNRLDIVIKHPLKGSIGIEVKCLGRKGHTAKLTQGIGQAMVALAHRDCTLLVIHCGTVNTLERDKLRTIAGEICKGTRVSIIVVP